MSQTWTHFLEGRKREEWVGELGNMACHKQGLTSWRGGRGRSGLVSLEMQGLTSWRGGRGRSGLVSWKHKDLLAGGEEEVGVGW